MVEWRGIDLRKKLMRDIKRTSLQGQTEGGGSKTAKGDAYVFVLGETPGKVEREHCCMVRYRGTKLRKKRLW